MTRLLGAWQEEYRRWRTRSLADRDYVYVWADGVHFNVRLEDDRLAALVLVGARPDGTKEVIAIEDGYRESTESWASVLRDLKRRGMEAPVVAVGDGALGFWAAVRDVWPETKEGLCWVHKIANVLDKLPKSIPRAKQALHAMMYAESKAACEREIDKFVDEYGAKYPKAVASLVDNRDRLLTFFAFPAEHWKHLRTTNPIESTFATVKLRQRVTKGAGSRSAGLAMAFKLMQSAQRSWRRLDSHELIPLVRAGVRFVDGKQQERKKGTDHEAAKSVAKGRRLINRRSTTLDDISVRSLNRFTSSMVEAKAAAVMGPTLGVVHSRSTVGSFCARCSRRPSTQASCWLTESSTAKSGAISDFSGPGSTSFSTRFANPSAEPLATRKPSRRKTAPTSEMYRLRVCTNASRTDS